MTTHSAAKLEMEDRVASLAEKLESLTQLVKSTEQRQSTHLENLDGRIHVLEKTLASLSQEVRESSCRIQEHGDHRRPIQKPIPFDGGVPWESYKLQFELLAQMNGWSDRDKGLQLAISLRGPAMGVLSSLKPESRHDYQALMGALDIRFGVAHQKDLSRAKLKARMRQRGENLPELAEDIERLTRLSYPDAMTDMVETLARDQFLDAFAEELRLKVRQNRPSTLRQALEIALEMESFELAGRHQKVSREVSLEEEQTLTDLVR